MGKLRKAKLLAQKTAAEALAAGKSPAEAKKLAAGAVRAKFDPDGPFMQLIMAFLMKLLEGWLKI